MINVKLYLLDFYPFENVRVDWIGSDEEFLHQRRRHLSQRNMYLTVLTVVLILCITSSFEQNKLDRFENNLVREKELKSLY